MTSEVASFEEAVRAAVEQGHAELARLDESTGDLSRAFARGQRGGPSSSDAITRLDDFTARFPAGLRQHLDRERESLGTFNIAFFGRTGVGKSTLLSVFGRLDGTYVSPGESDCTTEVHAVEWRDCRLYDTPGINGWGRTESRESLEGKARRAVEIADIVLLCFDTQSQQWTEFEKIAAWIRDHGKPAVAVLNVRNPHWRHPAKVPEALRRNKSEPVRQHADNIRTHLARIGLPDAPVVAVHSQRALFARAATPFRGPAADGLHAERTTFGTEYLERWSNVGTLERLMAGAIVEGAADLRSAALREDVRSRCRRGITELDDLAGVIEREAASVERDIESLFAVLGYPDDAERAVWLHDAALSADLVEVSELARRVPYTSPSAGTLDRFVRHLAISHLAGCHRKAKADVDDLIRRAFAEKRDIEESEFTAAVFDEDTVSAAVAAVWADRGAFLQRELEVAGGPGTTGAGMTLSRAVRILGDEGGGVAGDVVRGSGILLGAGAIAVPFAAIALLSNPVGWMIGAATVGVGIAGQVQQYFGKKMSAGGAQRAREAKAQATVTGHRAVDETFTGYEDSLVAESRKAAWTLLAPALAASLRTAIELRTARTRAGRLLDTLRARAAAIAPAPPVTDVLLRAQRRLGASTAEVTRALLGEDWLESGVDPHRPAPIDPAVQQMYASRREQDRERLERVLAAACGTPPAAGIHSWLAGLEDAARHDPELAGIVRTFRRVDAAGPALAVLGDYSSGKSSLIRRIMVDTGRQPPEFDIRASAATAVATRYPFAGFDLVDTPGLQSGDGEHDAVAFEAVVEAALVFVVVHINPLVGDTSRLEDLVRGAETVAAKGGRTVFLLNRCDELGRDPLTAPAEFLHLQDRKREELRAAFAARGITIGIERIHCLSGDPYGLVGADATATAASFDENRLWDGVAAVTGAMSALSAGPLSGASSAAAFDAAVTGLKRHRHALQEVLADCAAELRRSEPVIATVRAAVKDAVILETSLREDARRMVGRHLVAAKSAVARIDRKDARKLEDLVRSWWKAPEFEADLERHLAGTARKLDEWYSDHMPAIGREMRAAEFRVSPEFAAEFRARGHAWYENVTKGAGRVAGAVAPLVSVLGNREAVYTIGKLFQYNFKPWGAVNGAASVARAGVVLGVIASAADAVMMANDKRKDGKHKDQQEAALLELDGAAARLVGQILDGEQGDGPVGYLAEQIRELEALLGVHLDLESSIRERIGSVTARAGVAGALIAAAEELSGTTGRDE